MYKMLIIHDSASLLQILERRSQRQLILKLDALTPSESDYWQCKLNLLYSDCGCSTGAGLSFLSLGIYLAALFFQVGGIFTSMWGKTTIGIIVFFGSAGIGKAVGLRRAKHQLEQAVGEMTLILASRPQKRYEPRRMAHELS